MGTEKFKPTNDTQMYLLPPSVEDFVPESHLARVVDEIVEYLDTMVIENKYSHLGQKSYHPKTILKLLFYGYATGIRSGRKIAQHCESDTAYMFLARMYRPDFRTINDFRKDNIIHLQKYFVDIVKCCQQLGMGQVGMILIDSTKIRANASGRKTKNKMQYEQWLQRIDEQIKSMLEQAEQTDKQEDKLYGEKRGDELPEAIRSKERLKEKIKSVMQQSKVDKSVNLTDTDSQPIKSNGNIRPNYNCQIAQSEDGVIVCSYACTSASDKEQVLEIIEQTQNNTKQQVKEILADSGYSSYEVYEQLAQKQVVAYMPDQLYHLQTQRQQNPYDKSHFVYDKNKDQFICPQNKSLKYVGIYKHKRLKQKSKLYKGTPCSQCAFIHQCSKGKTRQIHRELREHFREEVRKRLDSKEGKQKYIKRMKIESTFGNLKFNLKYQMFQMRSKPKVDAEFKLMCIGHNLKLLHKKKLELRKAA